MSRRQDSLKLIEDGNERRAVEEALLRAIFESDEGTISRFSKRLGQLNARPALKTVSGSSVRKAG